MTVLYIYITIFTIFYIILALASLKSTKKIRDKYTNRDSNICVVVYASGKVDTLENLLKQLKNQNYPKSRYTIYAILDKCESLSDVTLQTDLDVNIININNLEPIGKSQAYSILAEKLSEVIAGVNDKTQNLVASAEETTSAMDVVAKTLDEARDRLKEMMV